MTPRTARRTLCTIAVAAAGACAAMALLGVVHGAVAAAGAIVALAVAGLVLAYRGLRPALGRATAAAAIALAGGLVFMAVATTSPVCPVVGAVDRCTTAQVGAITMTGVVAPVAYLSVPLAAGALARTGRKGGAAIARAVARRRPPGRP